MDCKNDSYHGQHMTQHLLSFMGSYHKVFAPNFHLANTQELVFSQHPLGNIQAKTPGSHGAF
jgi:hypothetical protein